MPPKHKSALPRNRDFPTRRFAELAMEKMNKAMEKMKILVGMDVDEEEAVEESSFIDDFNRQCTLTMKQVLLLLHKLILYIENI